MQRFKFAAVTSLIALSAPAFAAGDTLVFAGAEASTHHSDYGQVGMITALPGNSFGNGWALRATIDALTYSYRSGRTIDATAGGGTLALGYQVSGAKGWASAFTGPAYQYTHLNPDDLSSRARGSRLNWVVQGEGEYNLTQMFKLGLAGNYALADSNAYWTRARLLYRVSGEMFAGPEAVYQGDSDYNAYEVGAGLFGIPLAQGTQLGVHAGVRKVEKLSAGPYIGFEIGSLF